MIKESGETMRNLSLAMQTLLISLAFVSILHTPYRSSVPVLGGRIIRSSIIAAVFFLSMTCIK